MKSVAFGILFLAAIAPLRAQKVNIEFDDAAPFSDYRTFAIRQGRLNSKNPNLNSELTRKKLDNEIRRRLTERGLREVADKPDLNVVYTLGSGRKLETETYPAGWRGLGTRVVRVPYAEGTLVIDLRDTSKRSLVWRAVAVEEKSNAMQIAGHLEEMVRKSVEKYPPKIK